MIIKTIQWNIGGGRIRSKNVKSLDDLSYSRNGFTSIKKILMNYKPDLIFLQEAHDQKEFSQIENLASCLGNYYFYKAPYAKSHIEKGCNLMMGVISKFPLAKNSFQFFDQPKIKKIMYGGKNGKLHKKGVLSCIVSIGDKKIVLKSTHLFPFRRMKVDPLSKEMKSVIDSISKKLNSRANNIIIHGDFNFHSKSIKTLLPSLLDKKGVREKILKYPTTPRGRFLDHTIYKGVKLKKQKIDKSVLTDHYLVYTEFEI